MRRHATAVTGLVRSRPRKAWRIGSVAWSFARLAVSFERMMSSSEATRIVDPSTSNSVAACFSESKSSMPAGEIVRPRSPYLVVVFNTLIEASSAGWGSNGTPPGSEARRRRASSVRSAELTRSRFSIDISGMMSASFVVAGDPCSTAASPPISTQSTLCSVSTWMIAIGSNAAVTTRSEWAARSSGVDSRWRQRVGVPWVPWRDGCGSALGRRRRRRRSTPSGRTLA